MIVELGTDDTARGTDEWLCPVLDQTQIAICFARSFDSAAGIILFAMSYAVSRFRAHVEFLPRGGNVSS